MATTFRVTVEDGDAASWDFKQLARYERTYPERVSFEVEKPRTKKQVKGASSDPGSEED